MIYYWWVLARTSLGECSVCGAAVVQAAQDRHTAWHMAQEEAPA